MIEQLGGLIDWSRYTGKPIERTPEEQKVVDITLRICSEELNQRQVELSNPRLLYFIQKSKEDDTLSLSEICLPQYLAEKLEEFRMITTSKDFLTEEQLKGFLKDEKVPECFKTFHINNREYNKGIL